MAATTGYRTIYPAIIPKGTYHVDLVMTAGHVEADVKTVLTGLVLSSFLIDFQFRSTGSGHIRGSNIDSLPLPGDNSIIPLAVRAYLRLNCLTATYSPLWEEITGEPWTVDVPLRKARERQEAQNEIDAIVALSLGITADELCMIYRTQFPVMRRYDREDLYDANGRKVPNSIRKTHEQNGGKEAPSVSQRTWVHPQSHEEYVYEYPFSPLDRESGLRKSYDRFRGSVI